jgi:hypothetical protein
MRSTQLLTLVTIAPMSKSNESMNSTTACDDPAIQAAINRLGNNYLLHPDNKVQKKQRALSVLEMHRLKQQLKGS